LKSHEYFFDGPFGYWQGKLTPRDYAALTPLIWEHVNPYGRFDLDMNTRLALLSSKWHLVTRLLGLPQKGRHETVAWIKRLRDMRRFVEAGGPGVFLPPPPHDFVGRSEALEMLYAALAEEAGSALLHGEPGCGKSTLALKFAWQTQGAFDAVVFQLCGQRPIAEIAAEIAAKLKLGVETKPPEEQIAAAKAWLAERRALLVLDDIWENDVKALAPGPSFAKIEKIRLGNTTNCAQIYQ
jgi:hypothetical protein